MHRTIIHIGTHKTGTTSIQHCLAANREILRQHRVSFFRGRHSDRNHVELHVAAMRPKRLSPFKIRSGLSGDAAYRASVRQAVEAFTADAGDTAVFSAEGLSFLRHHDEVEWLRETFSGSVEIVVYLRNRSDYLASHRAELASKPHTASSYLDPASVFYAGPDSYLLNYEARLAPWQSVFGESNVHVLDYDRERSARGSVVPSFLDLIGVGHLADVMVDADAYLNTRKSSA